MDICSIRLKADGYILCQSSFYSVLDFIDNRAFDFKKGLNILEGEIDSGIFGISYLISMYETSLKKSSLFKCEAVVNEEIMPISKLSLYSCYLDKSYKLFSSKKKVGQSIRSSLKKSKMLYSEKDIYDMFQLSDFRISRTIAEMGNEKYNAMAAIAFCNAKEIFCFPWLSLMRYNALQERLDYLTRVLSSQGKTIIFPIGT